MCIGCKKLKIKQILGDIYMCVHVHKSRDQVSITSLYDCLTNRTVREQARTRLFKNLSSNTKLNCSFKKRARAELLVCMARARSARVWLVKTRKKYNVFGVLYNLYIIYILVM